MSKKNQKQRYEDYWKKYSGTNNFSSYERNLVLKSFFRPNEVFLDLASGDSIVGRYVLKEYSCKTYALDISQEAVSYAKSQGVRGVVGGVEDKLPFKSNFFDTVFWGDNIEHIWHPKFVCCEINRVLKPGGRLILSTPNMGYWRYRVKYFLTGVLPRSEGQVREPWEWEHIRFFNKRTIGTLLNKTKFQVIGFKGSTPIRLEKLLAKMYPSLFSSVMVIEAKKDKLK
jgi:ubiquinone/menaquinone biosynthesis C-methylase UbiE